ncbi:MAG: response regulator transcription factor [Bacteroidota bacterium]
MINVVIVEDLPIHQLYFKTIIDQDEQLCCLDVFDNGRDAIANIPSLNPHVVLIDLGLNDINGIECIAQLSKICPDIKFMVCTVHDEDENVFEALKSGANSYILKKSKPYQIIDAIVEMHEGGSPISSDIARKVLNQLPKIKAESIDTSYHITPREKEILNLLSRGLSYQEAADELYISVKTLKKHTYNIYQKLNAGNRTEALNRFFGSKAEK